MSYIASVLLLSRKDIAELGIYDPYALHKAVYSLFEDIRSDEDKKNGISSGILYADEGGDFNSRKIIMLSNRPPRPSINNKYGEIRSKKINPGYLNFQQYRFKVTVNPIRRCNESKKIIPIKQNQDIASWFEKRASVNWGFEVKKEQLRIDKAKVLKFKNKHKQQVTLSQVPIYGSLEVIDREKFINSFHMGIGRGKAFGCGLLQIVPVSERLFD